MENDKAKQDKKASGNGVASKVKVWEKSYLFFPENRNKKYF